MTAGGMPVWSLLKPLGAAGAAGRRSACRRVNHVGGPVGAAHAQRAGRPGAHRPDGAGHPALALHLARGQAHGAYPRPRPQRRAARAADARCARPQAGRHLPGRARPDHQAGRPGLPAHGQGPHRAPPGERCSRRRSSPSSAMRWTANQLEQRADQADSRAAARALHARARLRPIPTIPSTRRIRAATPPSCTSASPARSMPSPSCSLVVAFMGQAQTTRTSRMQAVIAAFAVAVALPHPRHHLRQRGGRAPGSCAAALCGARGRGLLAAVAIQWHVYPRRPLARWRARSRGLLERDRRGPGRLVAAAPRAARRPGMGASAHVRAPHAAPLRRQALPAVDPAAPSPSARR